MAAGRGMRDAALGAGFAVAERLDRVGLGGMTSRARRAAARLGGDRHTVEADGIAITGSLAEHGPYLRAVATSGHPIQTRLLTEAVRPGATVVDCGAHIGLQSLLAARAAGPEGRVLAIEPAPRNVEFLRENVAANGFADRVEVVACAVAESPGEVLIHVAESIDQSGVVRERQSPRTIPVRATTIDELLGGERFDVAKIDVEGAEALVLAGASGSIERSPGATLVVECHPYRLTDLGSDPVEFATGLLELGAAELIDEEAGRPVPADCEVLERAVDERPVAFGIRLVLR